VRYGTLLRRECDLDTLFLIRKRFGIDVPLPVIVDRTGVESGVVIVRELSVAIDTETGVC
jgi:hypothetical protein